MRISDWSSDVCSSDLIDSRHPLAARALRSGLGTAQQAQHFRAQRIAAEDQPLAREREVVLGIGPRPCERADRLLHRAAPVAFVGRADLLADRNGAADRPPEEAIGPGDAVALEFPPWARHEPPDHP